MAQEQTPHKRRVRYKGKYPKKYEEKYKELQPEKYGDTIAHVISKGNTPAGMHRSIMVQEILDFLKIQPGETVKMKVTAVAADLKKSRAKHPRILMITNDPENAKVVIRINVK